MNFKNYVFQLNNKLYFKIIYMCSIICLFCKSFNNNLINIYEYFLPTHIKMIKITMINVMYMLFNPIKNASFFSYCCAIQDNSNTNLFIYESEDVLYRSVIENPEEIIHSLITNWFKNIKKKYMKKNMDIHKILGAAMHKMLLQLFDPVDETVFDYISIFTVSNFENFALKYGLVYKNIVFGNNFYKIISFLVRFMIENDELKIMQKYIKFYTSEKEKERKFFYNIQVNLLKGHLRLDETRVTCINFDINNVQAVKDKVIEFVECNKTIEYTHHIFSYVQIYVITDQILMSIDNGCYDISEALLPLFEVHQNAANDSKHRLVDSSIIQTLYEDRIYSFDPIKKNISKILLCRVGKIALDLILDDLFVALEKIWLTFNFFMYRRYEFCALKNAHFENQQVNIELQKILRKVQAKNHSKLITEEVEKYKKHKRKDSVFLCNLSKEFINGISKKISEPTMNSKIVKNARMIKKTYYLYLITANRNLF